MCLDEMTEMLGSMSAENVSPSGLSGLSLAFIGDAVYEVLVRTHIMNGGDARVQTLHTRARELVNASFQARAADMLMPHFTDEETSIYKRGRNAPSAHTPKNKTEAEYHKATGFEAVFGWLWLKKDVGRLTRLFEIITEENGYENT